MATDEEKTLQNQDKIASKALAGTSRYLQNAAQDSIVKSKLKSAVPASTIPESSLAKTNNTNNNGNTAQTGNPSGASVQNNLTGDGKIKVSENTANSSSGEAKISISGDTVSTGRNNLADNGRIKVNEGTASEGNLSGENSSTGDKKVKISENSEVANNGVHVTARDDGALSDNTKVNIRETPQQRRPLDGNMSKQAFHAAEQNTQNTQPQNTTGGIPKGLSGSTAKSKKNTDMDMTAVANARLASEKWKIEQTDLSSKVRQYENAVGIGGISNHAAVYDDASLKNLDKIKISGAQDPIRARVNGDGSKAVYKQYSTDASHSKIVGNSRIGEGSKIVGITNDKQPLAGIPRGGSNAGGIIAPAPSRALSNNSKVSAGKAPGSKAGQSMGGSAEGTELDDAVTGYRNAQAVVHSARAGAVAAEGIAAGVGQAAVRSIEATGRIASSSAKGAINLGGKIYARGDARRAKKWSTKTANVNVKLDRMNAASKSLGRKGSEDINKGLKATVGFTSKTTFEKAKIIGEGVGSGVNKAGKWAVGTIQKPKTEKMAAKKAPNSKSETMKKSISDYKEKRKTKKQNKEKKKKEKKSKKSKNGFIKKIKMYALAAVLILCLVDAAILAPILLIPAILPDIFMADDSAAISQNVGNKAIEEMLEVQSDFLDEVCAYFDATCTAVDEDGNKIHVPHTAYFERYMGSPNNEYEDLLSGSTVHSEQSIATLYRTIISMATVATGNESEDADFYVKYCTSVLEKILHNSTLRDVDGVIAVQINDSSLIDGMKLDAQNYTCTLDPGCNEFFPKTDDSWMHTYGDNSLEYSTWLRSSSNYNEWEGWITDDQGSFDWAKTLYDLEAEDWAELNIELPNADGGGTGVAISSEDVATILDGVADQLSDSDSEKRLAVIERALYENNRPHRYLFSAGHGTYKKGEDLPVSLDCSGFVFGVLQTAGVRHGSGNTETASRFPDAKTLRPGDLILKYHNNNGQDHVILYLGETKYGKFTTIECTTRFSNVANKKISGVQLNTYKNLSDFHAHRGTLYDKFKNPYGD